MARWYWLEWRTADHVRMYARQWNALGPVMGLMFLLFFAGGLGMLLAYAGKLEAHGEEFLIMAVAGMSIGLGAVFFAAMCAFSLASSIARRLEQIDAELAALRGAAKVNGL